jgi:lysophospholipase L1-like esterase
MKPKLLSLVFLALATGSPVIAQTAPASKAAQTASQEIAIKNNESLAFMGDSITQFGAELPGGYVRLVISGFKANGIEVTPYPAGISGHKSKQMLERLEKDVLSKKPTWMTLSCGVNDVWHGTNGVPLELYKPNITALVEKAQAAGVKVMILTATMLGEKAADAGNVKLASYNDFLRQLAKEKGCLLADLNANMQAALKPEIKGNQLTRDGVHMNPFGDQMMATGVLRAFGLNESQIKVARDYWMDMPEIACLVDCKVGLTLRQYQQLSAMAAKQNQTVSDLVSAEAIKAIPAMLKVSQP